MDDVSLVTALERLAESGLVFRRGEPPNATYTFKHALVQDTAYGSLVRPARRQIHALIGRALENRFPDLAAAQPEIVAHHYTESDDTEVAIAYWQRAANLALQRSTPAAAVAHIESALSLVGSLPKSRLRDERELDLLTAQIAPLTAVKGYVSPESDMVRDRALVLCDQLNDTDRIFPILFGRFAYFVATSRGDEAYAAATDFLKRAEQKGDTGLRAVGHRNVCAALFHRGDHRGALEHSEQVIDLYVDSAHARLGTVYGVDPKSAGFSNRSGLQFLMGTLDSSIRSHDAAIDHARRIEHTGSLVFSLWFSGLEFRTLARDYTSSRANAEELLAISETLNLPRWPEHARFHLGRALFAEGETAEGLALMRGHLGEPGKIEWWAWHAAVMAEALGQIGETDEALELLANAQTLATNESQHWPQAEFWRIGADIMSVDGEAADAESYYLKAVDVAISQGAKSLELRAAIGLARYWQSQGRSDEARNLLAPVYGWFTEGVDTADLKESKALLDELF